MVKEYFAALFHSWVGKMSGPASVILVFLPLVWPSLFGRSTILVRATWMAALICFLIANYSAWKYERDRYEAEIHKNALPLISGTLSNFRFGGIMTTGHIKGKWHIAAAANFDLYLCNRTPRETNLQKIELDGSNLMPPIEFGTPALIGNQNQNAGPGIILADGKGVTIPKLLVRVQVYDFQDKSQVPPIDLKKLKVFAVDGFLTKHPLEVKDGETLSFRSQWESG